MVSAGMTRIQVRRSGAGTRRVLIACGLALCLSGCVTTASKPFSGFSTFGYLNRAPASAESQPHQAANEAATDASPTSAMPPAASTAPASSRSGAIYALSGIMFSTAPQVATSLDRKAVYPQVASASVDMQGILATTRLPSPTPSSDDIIGNRKARGDLPGVSLSDAVGVAVLSNPLMGAQAAKVTGSSADVRVAEGATKPSLQVYGGSGGSFLGTYSNYPAQFGQVNIPASYRSDAGFTFRQLVYDFGAAKSDIARTKSLVDSERLRLADQAEDIGLRTVNAYLNLLEQKELIGLIDQVVVDNNSFANLVQLSERQGNGTVADVSRIKSKVIEVEALRTDIMTAYQIAQDEFFRLTKMTPKQVHRPASILSQVPKSVDAAMQAAKQFNPSLLAMSATGVSIDHQLAAQKAQALPRIDLQGDGLVKHYLGSAPASQGIVDTRLMLMLSYKLLDGGVGSAQVDRIRADRRANDFKVLDEMESIELNLRRFYQALSANRTKETAAVLGVSTARTASSLYIEQFKAGKRTVFEVLDSRMVVFTMQKNHANAGYEQLRAAYGILRNTGRLVDTVVRL
jgi:outer membrane protein, adhesin transport system